jgi:hypothetical protein
VRGWDRCQVIGRPERVIAGLLGRHGDLGQGVVRLDGVCNAGEFRAKPVGRKMLYFIAVTS